MPKQELWKYIEDDGGRILGYEEEWLTSNVDKNPALTLEEIADFSDGQAESRNNHEYCGTHRILAALLHRKLGREQATKIMREIAEYGGLDGMSGCGGEADAFADFGIEDCWKDWELEDKEVQQPFKPGQHVRVIGGTAYAGKVGVIGNFHGDVCGEEDEVADNGGTDEIWIDFDPDGEFGAWITPSDIEAIEDN